MLFYGTISNNLGCYKLGNFDDLTGIGTFLVAMLVVSLWLATAPFVLFRKLSVPVDPRYVFHLTRIGPWALVSVLGLVLAVLDVYDLRHMKYGLWHDNDKSDASTDSVNSNLDSENGYGLLTLCISPVHYAWSGNFMAVLLNDLVWLGGYFRTLHKKKFLCLHHLVYIAQGLVMLTTGKIAWILLVMPLALMEESMEMMNSASYLLKDRSDKKGKTFSGLWWKLFSSIWRILCTAWALGVFVPVIFLFNLSWGLIIILVVEIMMWFWFILIDITDLIHFELSRAVTLEVKIEEGMAEIKEGTIELLDDDA